MFGNIRTQNFENTAHDRSSKDTGTQNQATMVLHGNHQRIIRTGMCRASKVGRPPLVPLLHQARSLQPPMDSISSTMEHYLIIIEKYEFSLSMCLALA